MECCGRSELGAGVCCVNKEGFCCTVCDNNYSKVDNWAELIAPGRVDVGNDEDEGSILSGKLPGVGVVIEGNVINGDEAVVIELEIWMALKKSLSHNCFCTSYSEMMIIQVKTQHFG